ncbi:enoyl-CoA hydratase [Rhodoligotrophos appendicifer]|uniref:enoyl-CoA hydratase/isomerase family protein n=1 Tax=Rhodoligotrophos appendicifer TaxID=987056 RepID=UPI001184BF0C|nr:enoyl-CoA hydratase/isomerase family protein [Rhodoligotrophos appendicifer]
MAISAPAVDRYECLAVSTADQILTVLINRPDKRNALSRAALAEIEVAFSSHRNRQDLRAAVITGAGDISFAAGGDLKDLESVKTADEAAAMALRAKHALDAIRSFPLPTIAALNGDALGGGAELAVACDFRIAAAHARIGFVQGRLAISTAWGGAIDLMELVGRRHALKLLATAEIVEPSRALQLGLIDEVAAPDQTLNEVVSAFIARFDVQRPQVLRAFKAVNHAYAQGAGRAGLMETETQSFVQTWIHDDHWDAATRVLTRTKPS